jgi:hypothetical protein
MKRSIFYLVLLISWQSFFQPATAQTQTSPIALHPENPHYFIFRNTPQMLITSGEHYGAVLNLDFDFVQYLDELQHNGLNLTRVFSGAYVEPQGAFHIAKNTLAPASGRFICPWARSAEPGYALGGNKFDLSRWDDQYFVRLKQFMSTAAARNIIVEFTFYCPFYEEKQWEISPLNPTNNVHGPAVTDRKKVYTLQGNNPLLPIEDNMVRKVVTELKDYDNLIYEICNEPYAGDISEEWQQHIAKVIADTENQLNVHHLISQNIANGGTRIIHPDPLVSVFNFHYASPPFTVYQNYGLHKVIGNNETGFRGQADSTYRRVAWQFMLAGGGLFNHLDYSFSVGHETGDFHYPSQQPGGGSPALRAQLGYLKRFLAALDFIHMSPDTNLLLRQLPSGTSAYVLDRPGMQYAFYFNGGSQVTFQRRFPAGTYRIEWMDPVTGKYLQVKNKRTQSFLQLRSPTYSTDIALRITRVRTP